jgi:hypothetical protein
MTCSHCRLRKNHRVRSIDFIDRSRMGPLSTIHNFEGTVRESSAESNEIARSRNHVRLSRKAQGGACQRLKFGRFHEMLCCGNSHMPQCFPSFGKTFIPTPRSACSLIPGLCILYKCICILKARFRSFPYIQAVLLLSGGFQSEHYYLPSKIDYL